MTVTSSEYNEKGCECNHMKTDETYVKRENVGKDVEMEMIEKQIKTKTQLEPIDQKVLLCFATNRRMQQ